MAAVCSRYVPFSFQCGTFPVILLEINKVRSNQNVKMQQSDMDVDTSGSVA